MLEYLTFLLREVPPIDTPEDSRPDILLFHKRLREFIHDIQRQNFNQRLARKMLLISSLQGLLSHHVYLVNDPEGWTWISDRDAILDKYDGFTFDNAYHSFFFFTMLQESLNAIDLTKLGRIVDHRLKIPRIVHIDKGISSLDSFIRIPDYVAGILSDFDLKTKEFSAQKLGGIPWKLFFRRENHTILQLVMDEQKIGYCTRRLQLV